MFKTTMVYFRVLQVYLEVNLAFVPKYTSWIDSGATTDISVSIQGCLRY